MVINMINKTKYGFSLMEACVVMLIASIFIVVMANVIPRKVSVKSMAEAHGRFECYYNASNVLYQEEFNSGASSYGAPVAASTHGGGTAVVPGTSGSRPYCRFVPNKYAKYYIINAVGAGGKGGSSVGGNAGKFQSVFSPAFTGSYLLFPGNYTATSNKSLSNTYVVKEGSSKQLLSAAGGSDGGSILTSTLDDINDCLFTKTSKVERYDCGRTPTCMFKNGKIYVKHCVNQEVTYQSTFKLNDANSTNCVTTASWGGIRGRLVSSSGGYSSSKLKSVMGLYGIITYDPFPACDYETLLSNPWIKFNENTGELLYPDVYIPLKVGDIKPHKHMDNTWYPRADYEKSPSLYTMLLYKVVEADSSEGAESTMTTMAKAFGYSAGLQNSSGRGGNAGSTRGQAGAVVITW